MGLISRRGHRSRLALVLVVFALVLVAGSVMPAYSTGQEGSVATSSNIPLPKADQTSTVKGGSPSSASVKSNAPSSVNVFPKNQFVGLLPARRDSSSSVGDGRANNNLGAALVGCGTSNGICGNLTYHKGPVMHNPADFLIFWLPSGYSFDNPTIDPGATNPSDSAYEQLI